MRTALALALLFCFWGGMLGCSEDRVSEDCIDEGRQRLHANRQQQPQAGQAQEQGQRHQPAPVAFAGFGK